MKVTVQRVERSIQEVEVPYGATVAEAIDAAELDFLGCSYSVNGRPSCLGRVLSSGNLVSLLREAMTGSTPSASAGSKRSALNEEEADDLFLTGKIGMREYMRLIASPPEPEKEDLTGTVLVFRDAKKPA